MLSVRIIQLVVRVFDVLPLRVLRILVALHQPNHELASEL